MAKTSINPEAIADFLPENLVEQMIEAGVHFGHRSSRWNPKMKAHILTKRNLIHIIDLKSTVRGLLRATTVLEKIAEQGGDVLIVGTKWQAREVVRKVCADAGIHFVTERWLGGTLTNHSTIRLRLKRLEELEALESTGELGFHSKKMQVRLMREKEKIFRNLEGIRTMEKVPTVLFVVDARREVIALKEAEKLGIPTIAIIDTDSDPELVDIAIPANDDAHRSLEVLLTQVGEAVKRGREEYKKQVALRVKREAEQAALRKQQQQQAQAAAASAAASPTPAPKLGVRKVTIPGAAEGAEAAPAPADATPPAPAAPETPPAETPTT